MNKRNSVFFASNNCLPRRTYNEALLPMGDITLDFPLNCLASTSRTGASRASVTFGLRDEGCASASVRLLALIMY